MIRYAGTSYQKILVGIVLFGSLLRLYGVSRPLADWHSFRQSDTASVTREYVKNGIDLLHPRYHDLSNVQSGMRVNGADNVQGWRMVEFPFVNAIIAVVIRTFPTLSKDLTTVSRVFSIIASISSIVGIALVGRRLISSEVGLYAAFFFAINPYAVYYGRAILPEPYMVACIIWSLFFFLVYIEKKTMRSLFLYALFLALAVLLKPFAVLYATLFLAALLLKLGGRGLMDPKLFFMTFGSFFPLYLWRLWIQQYPSGIPADTWLLNGNGIRLRPAWFRWLFYERLTKLIAGYVGLFFLLPVVKEVFQKNKNVLLLFFLGGLGPVLYLIIVASGNVQHDYYQVILLLYLSLLIGYGAARLSQLRYGSIIVSALFVLSFVGSLRYVRGYFMIINPALVRAGEVVDQMVPHDAKVIAPYGGDTAFLYATNRTGWPVGFSIPTKIAEGATHYISLSYDDEARELERKYKTLSKTPEYILLDLSKPL